MPHREQILQQALTLPPEDRAYVATELERSLSDAVDQAPAEECGAGSDGELLRELQRRSAAYRTGSTTARSAADVLADLRRRQSGEPSP